MTVFPSGRISRDIRLQLVDRVGLGRDDPVHQVANGNNAEDAVPVQHREMANPVFGHQPHAILDRVGGRDRNNLIGKDFANGRLFGGLSFERDFTGVIAFRHDSNELALVNDHKRADIFFSHHLDGIEYHGVWRNGPNIGAFVIEDFVNGACRDHDCLDNIVG